jgi:NTE family protein
MAEEGKVHGALGWLRTAKEKFREFAYGEEGEPAERPRVGLALAGGFARGLAHIGVLRVLREAGIPIDCVAGTSVGALIAASYCAGVPLEEMERIGAMTTFADFGRWTPSWLGLATNQRMEKYFARFTQIKTFEQLRTPLAVATTDINAGVSVYYSHGPIMPPIRASCAYPVEGALLLGADIVIAVYLEAGSLSQPRTFTDVLSRAFTIVQRHSDLAWRTQADVVIEPDVKPFVWDDFSKTPQMVAAGEAAALAALPQIRAALRKEKRDSAA